MKGALPSSLSTPRSLSGGSFSEVECFVFGTQRRADRTLPPCSMNIAFMVASNSHLAVHGERCYGTRLNRLVAFPHGSVNRALQDVYCWEGSSFNGLQYEFESATARA